MSCPGKLPEAQLLMPDWAAALCARAVYRHKAQGASQPQPGQSGRRDCTRDSQAQALAGTKRQHCRLKASGQVPQLHEYRGLTASARAVWEEGLQCTGFFPR